MLYAQYEQATGRFRLVEIVEGGRETILDECLGYAGRASHRNRPESQHVVGFGPIPRGAYHIGPAHRHPRLGPVAFQLEPHRRNEMFGRGGFFIHGDNSRGDASHGCIILNRTMRQAIRDSGCRYLDVIEGASVQAKPGDLNKGR